MGWLMRLERRHRRHPEVGAPDRMRGNLNVLDFELAATIARITALDTGTTLFFDHRDPQQVSRLGKRRVDC